MKRFGVLAGASVRVLGWRGVGSLRGSAHHLRDARSILWEAQS